FRGQSVGLEKLAVAHKLFLCFLLYVVYSAFSFANLIITILCKTLRHCFKTLHAGLEDLPMSRITWTIESNHHHHRRNSMDESVRKLRLSYEELKDITCSANR